MRIGLQCWIVLLAFVAGLHQAGAQNLGLVSLQVGNGPASVIAADVSGGASLDLICANSGDDTLSVLTNNGSGVFVSNATYMVGNSPDSVVAADVNGDGSVDLICANSGDDTLSVLTNNGSGVLVSNATYMVGNSPNSVVAADVNDDGNVDLICENQSDQTISVLTNNGLGVFVSNALYSVPNRPVSVVAADVNGDYILDLVCAFGVHYNGPGELPPANNGLLILTNDGTGVFRTNTIYSLSQAPTSLVAADVNGDGNVDLICTVDVVIPSGHFGFPASVTSEILVLTNNGLGVFGFNATYTNIGYSTSLAAFDVNGDSSLDLICANQTLNTLSVLTNNGSGVFVSNGTYSVGPAPVSVTAWVVDAIGTVDLVCADSGTNTLSLLQAAPAIETQPQSLSVSNGSPTAFTVLAAGMPPLFYQWQLNGTDLEDGGNFAGSASNILALTPATILDAGSYSVIVTNAFGSVTSDVAVLSVSFSPIPPSIQSQPMSAIVASGNYEQLAVTASGAAPLVYQWYFNGISIAGATASILAFQSPVTNQSGNYVVIVTNLFGSITSAPAFLAVYDYPAITSQYPDTNLLVTAIGASETFSVVATGTALAFQWFDESGAISGATNASLTISNITSSMDGDRYYVAVTNDVGLADSDSVQLSVVLAARELPYGYWEGTGYWPGVPMTYVIHVGPPAGTPNYSAQDEIDAVNGAHFEYYVTNVSEDGVWDSVHSTVKFGPYFDGNPRTLTYQIVPAANCTNWVVLKGTVSINGANTSVLGPASINLLPLQPADNGGDDALPIDGIININEMTAYASAWRRGANWPVEPSLYDFDAQGNLQGIPQDYVTSAVGIWQEGEDYVYVPADGPPPACWVSPNAPPGNNGGTTVPITATVAIPPKLWFPRPVNPVPQTPSNSPAVSSMPSQYTAGVPFTVTLTITPSNGVSVYAVEDQIPAGWVATNFMPSDPAVFDFVNNMVKWGPYFDDDDRILSYQITPPANASGTVTFSGTASFDGAGVTITGVRQISPASALSVTAGTFSRTNGFQINVAGGLGATYILQASSNLLDWISLQTNVNSSGTLQLTDPQATNFNHRFYRAVSQ
jgi:hypothetical protein